ncbi:hypothetical protein [Winogradskyella undariae]|uniref:hypothetical protein n=1 Tax=Winogradskyella undariae TaxID=1285465 RepID=UPI001C54BDFE|nr:hypothetical protein [Winogradskyella undariae]
MVIIKIILIVALIMVFIQDRKDREVYWFLFPIIAFASGVLLYNRMQPELFFITSIINMLFIIILFTVVFLYSKFKLRTSITNTFGLGDGLLFMALAFTFSSVSFMILFVFGLIFSLLIHVIFKKKSKYKTVPLAGYLSLFFMIIYLSYWLDITPNIYTI